MSSLPGESFARELYARRWVKFLQDDFKSGSGLLGPWEVGKQRSMRKYPVLCVCGFHATNTFLAALPYAPGDVAAVVKVAGKVDYSLAKSCFQRMTVVKMLNVRSALLQFAQECFDRFDASPRPTHLTAFYLREEGEVHSPMERMRLRFAQGETIASWVGAVARGTACLLVYAHPAAPDVEREWQEKRLDELIQAAFEAAENPPASQAIQG